MLPSLWTLISSSSQERSEIFCGFIQGIIFLFWGCGCTGKQEDARWNLSTSSMRELWASMWQALQGCVFLISAHPAFHSTFTTAAIDTCAVQVMQMQTFVCNLFTVFFTRCHYCPQWQAQYHCSSQLSTSDLSFSCCRNGWHCEENVFDVERGVVKSWIMNCKSWQCCWLDLKRVSFSSKTVCLSLQRRG